PVQTASSNYVLKVYLVLLAGVTVVWCTSMVLLFADLFFARRSFPDKFREVQRTPWGVLALCGVVGVVADSAAVVLLFWCPWGTIFAKRAWCPAVGTITVVSIVVRLVIYVVSERARREVPGATAQVEGGLPSAIRPSGGSVPPLEYPKRANSVPAVR